MDEREFQNKCAEFVSREVWANVSTMVEYILSKYDDENAPFNTDDIENPMESAEFIWNGERVRVDSIDEFEEWRNAVVDTFELEHNAILNDITIDYISNKITTDEYNNIIGALDNTYEKLIDDLFSTRIDVSCQLHMVKEIYEYWKCSPWLINKLRKMNEAVIDCEDIWCRCTTGQSIAIDDVIRDIVKWYILTDDERESLNP